MVSVSQDIIYCRLSRQLATVTISTAVCKDLVLLETHFLKAKRREKKIILQSLDANSQTANFETSIFILSFLAMHCMTTVYISGLFLSHLRKKVHP